MTQELNQVNTIAPLKNVALMMKVADRIVNRSEYLPGLASFAGPSGTGKSMSAAFVANKYKAFYVECKSCWTKRALLEAVLKQMGLPSKGPIYSLVEQISEHLAETGKMLIIDEVDHIVKRSAIEIIRDIYEGSQAPILLIGEENMPNELSRWERFHGRVLEWAYAQPADIQDARHLVSLYCRKVSVRDDLLKQVVKASEGSVRRICVNLARIAEIALGGGHDEMGMAEWGNKPFYTSSAPRRNS